MNDKRELILKRLVEIASSVEGIVVAYRNNNDISEKMRPALVILDADEVSNTEDLGRGRPFAALRRVTMTPEMYLLLGGKPDEVGTSLNLFRARIIKAILSDVTLAELVGTSGQISYDGCVTSLARGRTMEGECSLVFSFMYILNPNDIA